MADAEKDKSASLLSRFDEEFGDGYQLVTEGSDWAEIRFLGTLNGTSVLWQARVETLAHRCRHQPSLNSVQNTLDIALESNSDGYWPATISINVAAIDPAALTMTIKMMRQYRRLRAGLHHYGPPIPCP